MQPHISISKALGGLLELVFRVGGFLKRARLFGKDIRVANNNALLPAIQDARTCRSRAWDFCRALFGDLVHMPNAIHDSQPDKESTERDITPQLPRILIQQSRASLCDGHAAGEAGRLCARPPEWKGEKR